MDSTLIACAVGTFVIVSGGAIGYSTKYPKLALAMDARMTRPLGRAIMGACLYLFGYEHGASPNSTPSPVFLLLVGACVVGCWFVMLLWICAAFADYLLRTNHEKDK